MWLEYVARVCGILSQLTAAFKCLPIKALGYAEVPMRLDESTRVALDSNHLRQKPTPTKSNLKVSLNLKGAWTPLVRRLESV